MINYINTNRSQICCLLHVWLKDILYLFTQISKYVSPQCNIFNNAKLTEPQAILMEY